MPGALHTRGLVCSKKAHELVTTGMLNTPAFPARWFYGLCRALPGVPGFLATVACPACRVRRADIAKSAGLIPASGDQDHTISPSALAPLVLRCLRVHRISHPTSVTIAKRPSCRARDARK